MLSSKHFQTNSSGLASLCVTAKRILSLCSICRLSRFIFLRSPSCNFTQVDCLECMAQTVAFHWKGCNVRSRLSCYPAQLRWHPRTSGSYYFTGGKLHFGEQLFDFQTEGAVKKMWKKNQPSHQLSASSGSSCCDSLPNLNQVGRIDQLRWICRHTGVEIRIKFWSLVITQRSIDKKSTCDI